MIFPGKAQEGARASARLYRYRFYKCLLSFAFVSFFLFHYYYYYYYYYDFYYYYYYY